MLDYLVVKFESFDTEGLIEHLTGQSKNGIILLLNYAGEIKVAHKPDRIPLAAKYRYWTPNRWIKWPLFFIRIFLVILSILRREKVDHFLIYGGDVVLWIAQVFKFAGRIERTTNVIEDWSLPMATDDIFVRLNKFKIKLNDYFMNCADTSVVVTNREIFEERNKYWNGQSARNSVLVDNHWTWFLRKRRDNSAKAGDRYICSLGNLRENMGIEKIFELLPELRKEFGISFKVIGPETDMYRQYQKLAGEMGVSSFIVWKGFVAREDLAKELDECFCGINIQENADNNSRLVIAGRVVNYLENLVVPIISQHSGAIVKFVEDHKMGLICDGSKGSIRSAIVQALAERASYVRSIEEFIEKNPYKKPNQSVLSFQI